MRTLPHPPGQREIQPWGENRKANDAAGLAGVYRIAHQSVSLRSEHDVTTIWPDATTESGTLADAWLDFVPTRSITVDQHSPLMPEVEFEAQR